jgi:hypothetical protein
MVLWFVLGGSLCGGVVLLLVALILARNRRYYAKQARIAREGETVLAWIVMANKALYEKNLSSNCSYAQVVFTLEEGLPDLEGTLKAIAKKLPAFEPSEHHGEDERIIGSVMKTGIPYPYALRIPNRVTGGVEAYTISVKVYWNKLPHRRLTLPYLYCKVLLGKEGGALMAESPDD